MRRPPPARCPEPQAQPGAIPGAIPATSRRSPQHRAREAALSCAEVAAADGMTAEEMKADGAPLEGVDITPKQDEGVLKVRAAVPPSSRSALARRGPRAGGERGRKERGNSSWPASGCSPGAVAPVCPLYAPRGRGRGGPRACGQGWRSAGY